MLAFLTRAPLVLICLFFTLGVILEFEIDFNFNWTVTLFFVLFCIVLWLNQKKKSPLIQTTLIFFISALLGVYTTSHFLQRSSRIPKGTIEINFQIEKKLRPNQYIGIIENNPILVELKDCDTLLPGNELIAMGEIKEIEPPKLPWIFNQKKQMLSNGITHQLVVSRIIKTSKQDENSLRFLPQKIQRDLQQNITNAIQDSSSSAILSALLLGETSLLSKEITSDYSVAGVVHILAVSGMHVALIYQLILFVLKLVLRKKRKWLTFILAMTLLWGYGAITGFSASVVRACCMFSFFVLSDCFLLSRNTGNTIAGSTLLILYFQPYLIFNLGFLLSLSAVLGIVVIHPLIMRFGYTENKIGYYLLSSTSITLSAQITTLPLTLYIFHSFPTYFIFANLILVPWSSLILYIGITFMLLSGIPFIGPLIAEILSVTTSAMNKFIHLIQYLPRAQLTGINFNQEQLLFSYLLLLAVILFLFFKWKHTLHFTGITVLLFIFFSYKPSTKTGVLFTYYQSNFLLLGTEKELFLACNNDTLSKRYLFKLNSWKYQRNRASQEIKTIPFPSRLTISENGTLISIGTINSNKNIDFLLLNEELKNQKVDSAFLKEIQHEKILLGKGVPRRKAEAISSFLEEKNIAIQNIQSQPFIIK